MTASPSPHEGGCGCGGAKAQSGGDGPSAAATGALSSVAGGMAGVAVVGATPEAFGAGFFLAFVAFVVFETTRLRLFGDRTDN